MVDLDKLLAFFKKDVFCLQNGIHIDEVSEDNSLISLRVDSRHLNADGAVQGGVIFTMADFAFAVHANSFGKRVVTQSANITYLRPAFTTFLTAVAKAINRGKSTCLYEVNVRDERDKIVAHATITGFILDDNTELL